MSQIRRRMAETTNYEQCTTRYEIRNTQEFTPDVSSLAFLSGAIQSTNYFVRNYQRNMQNKPNLVRRRRIANERKVISNNEL